MKYFPLLMWAFVVILFVASIKTEQKFEDLRVECEAPFGVDHPDYPDINIPMGMRQENWIGSRGSGSCVHASMIMLYRWMGWPSMATYWRWKYGNGEYASRFHRRLDAENVRWAATTTGDVDFLDWACSTRRGCAISTMYGRHFELLVHLDSEVAGVLDNNNIGKIKWYTRSSLIKYWKNSGGWSVGYVGIPPAPKPKREIK